MKKSGQVTSNYMDKLLNRWHRTRVAEHISRNFCTLYVLP